MLFRLDFQVTFARSVFSSWDSNGAHLVDFDKNRENADLDILEQKGAIVEKLRVAWCEALSAVGPICKKSWHQIAGNNFHINHLHKHKQIITHKYIKTCIYNTYIPTSYDINEHIKIYKSKTTKRYIKHKRTIFLLWETCIGAYFTIIFHISLWRSDISHGYYQWDPRGGTMGTP